MNDNTHLLLIRVVDLFTFSHDSNRNKQGGCVTSMWLEPSGPAKFHYGALMWPHRNPLGLCGCVWNLFESHK